MSSPSPVTETVVLHLQQGVTLEDVYAGRGAGNDTPANALLQLGDTLKVQDGCIRQFWGQQVENPSIFVWSIDWASFEQHKTFINSEKYTDFMAGLAQVFDLQVAAPAMMHTAFTSDVTGVREAPVTEFAFFHIARNSDEATKTKMEDAAMPHLQATSTVGKATGLAVGWVFEDQEHPQAPNGEAIAFQILIGWPSLAAHMEFRATPEFAANGKPLRELILPPVEGKSMFHVEFHAGV